MSSFKVYQVDAFTEKLFGGNPAAVVPLSYNEDITTRTKETEKTLPWDWPQLSDFKMQKIAAENNLAETAYYCPKNKPDPHLDEATTTLEFFLRWFTPTMEINLCGHATLAAAFAVFKFDVPSHVNTLVFHTKYYGALEVTREKVNGLLSMYFPVTPIERVNDQAMVEQFSQFFTTTTTTSTATTKSIVPQELYKAFDYMMIYETEEEIASLTPDLKLILEKAPNPIRGIIVTAPGKEGSEIDFVSRFFAPHAGVDEDPTTGSAHTILAPYWSQRLGKKVLAGRQISNRIGDVACEVLEGEKKGLVLLAGHCVLYLSGEIFV